MTTDNSSKLPRITRKLLKRIFSKIIISTVDFYENVPCWEWQAFKDEDGYGKMGYTPSNGLPYTNGAAYRILYGLFVEPIPSDLQCDHLCRNRGCVNPIHIEAVTPRINTLRSPISPASLNAQKTHCPKGHPFTEEHLATSPSHLKARRRICRTCYNEWQKTPQQRERKSRWQAQRRTKLKSLD